MTSVEEPTTIEEPTTLVEPKAPAVSPDDFFLLASDNNNDDDASTTTNASSTASSAQDASSSTLPLFQYSRLSGALARLSIGATTTTAATASCSCIGKVVLNAESTLAEGEGSAAAAAASMLPATAPAIYSNRQDPPMSLWQHEVLPLLWMGLDSGALCLLHATTATPVMMMMLANNSSKPTTLSLRDTSNTLEHGIPIVAVSMDATGTQLAAIDQKGLLGVFDVKYKLVWTTTTTTTTTNNPTTTASTTEARPAETTTAAATTTQARSSRSSINPLFSGIFSAFSGGSAASASSSLNNAPIIATSPPPPPQPLTSSSHNANTSPQQQQQEHTPALAFASVALSHSIRYPASFGRPSCLAVDPSYRRKREKSVVVGFDNGRLVLTKKGLFLQRRVDAVLYQGVAVNNDNEYDHGKSKPSGPTAASRIQALVWRGSLLAWADATGIRIMDMDTLTRIAHVDRPTGARPNLYPTIRDFTPQMVFETADKLLCAWGDCLLTLRVREAAVSVQHPSSSSSAGGTSNNAIVEANATEQESPLQVSTTTSDEEQLSGSELVDSTTRSPSPTPATIARNRRIVECTMAWQLDCVAVGVVPMDANHVAVLGLAPPLDLLLPPDDHQQQQQEGQGANNNNNDAELQIISRMTGTVIYADVLPFSKATGLSGDTIMADSVAAESARGYSLLSTFCFPRMDNTKEAKDELVRLGQEEDADMALFSSSGSRHQFWDPHLKWNLEQNLFGEYDNNGKDEEKNDNELYDANDDASVDSDDYGIILQPIPVERNYSTTREEFVPPQMIILAPSDVVLARISDIDDAIAHALLENKAGLALRRGLCHMRTLKRYDIRHLVNEYFRALLRLPPYQPSEKVNDSTDVLTQVEESQRRHLSLRRMQLAAEAMPILLGGDLDMWTKWIKEAEKIPGALFMTRKFVPVRDPVLPKEVYGSVLKKMLQQVEVMAPGRLADEAAGHFLDTLVAWGSTSVLKRFIKLFQYESATDSRVTAPLRAMEESLKRRETQSAACYLQIPGASQLNETQLHEEIGTVDRFDDMGNALYDVEGIAAFVLERVTDNEISCSLSLASGLLRDDDVSDTSPQMDSRVNLEALVRLKMMTGSFDDALRCYLMIGSRYSSTRLDDIEDEAIAVINDVAQSRCRTKLEPASYTHVLSIIESLHLHQCLLELQFIANDAIPPLFALLQLVGLDVLGDFLIEHCVAPQSTTVSPALTFNTGDEGSLLESKTKTNGERIGTLPLDLVANQLERRPKLLHWYLHLVFTRKPDVYVNFPTTASPPEDITRLHRKHIDLYIKFAGNLRDSSCVFQGVEAFRVPDTNTPLLAFLKIALQTGAVAAAEIAKKLEVERKGRDGNGQTFALELAFIMEHFGGENDDEARLILDLYLKGVKSLMLAVSFAQRSRHYSAILWKILIDYCMETFVSDTNVAQGGTMFGSLLEAAALSGGDLASLISQIPPGMAIEGLRPRLVATVADYRLKVQIGENASRVASEDRIALLREVEYRSRRGLRVDGIENLPSNASVSDQNSPLRLSTRLDPAEASSSGGDMKSKNIFHKKPLLSPNRLHHRKLALSLPIR